MTTLSEKEEKKATKVIDIKKLKDGICEDGRGEE